MQNLRWKIITILVVLFVFFGLGIYPILAGRYHLPVPEWLAAKQLKLGLDLKGGVQLTMRVNTDDALRLTTTNTSEQLRESLKNGNVPFTNIIVDSATAFHVEGVPGDRTAELRNAADEITSTNYDRNPGAGGRFDFTMKPTIERDLREQTVEQAVQTIDRRVNALGVTEPTIARQKNNEILVQLPGVADVARAKEIMGSPSLLELKLVEAGPMSSKEDLLKPYN